MKDYYGDDLKTFVIKVKFNNEFKYILTKTTAIHFKDMARKFSHKKSARRYYIGSVFYNMGCEWNIVDITSD